MPVLCGIFYPHGRLPASVNFCNNEKKNSTDYPHWQITRTQKQKKIVDSHKVPSLFLLT